MHDKHLSNNWNKLVALCAKISSKKQLVDIFDLLLTDAEQDDLAARHAIITSLLSNKKTQREIAKDLKLSIAKVTRGANALKLANEKLKKILRVHTY